MSDRKRSGPGVELRLNIQIAGTPGADKVDVSRFPLAYLLHRAAVRGYRYESKKANGMWRANDPLHLPGWKLRVPHHLPLATGLERPPWCHRCHGLFFIASHRRDYLFQLRCKSRLQRRLISQLTAKRRHCAALCQERTKYLLSECGGTAWRLK